MPNAPLNPDAEVSKDQTVFAYEAAERDYPQHGSIMLKLHHSNFQSSLWQVSKRTAESLRDQLNDLLAVAQPVVNNVEELVMTRAGLALANTAFEEGLSAGIRACNATDDDAPFKKPVSPYSAPLLAMIKADRPEVDDA